MELRPRKGRSVQPPSTPTPTSTPAPSIAKPSPRLPPQSSSRKIPASVPSTPFHIPSDNEGEDHKEIHVDLVDGATKEIHAEEEVTAAFTEICEEHTRKQGNQDIILSDDAEFETPLSSIARLRRAHIKGTTSNVKSKTEATSTKKKKKMAKVSGSTRVADTSIAHDRIAATSEKVGLDEAMAEKLSGFPSEDVASEEIEKQEAFTGIALQKSDELAVEINLLAPQEVCVKKTEVLSSSIDSKQLHSSVKKSGKKRGEKSKVDDAKLDKDGHTKNIVDVDAPIVSESQGLSLILSDDEAVQVSDDAGRVDGCEKKISASKKAALENRLPGAEASKASRESKKSQFHKKDIVEEEMRSRKLFEETSDVTIPCIDKKFDDQSKRKLGLIADSSKEGVQVLSEESSDEAASSGEEREGDINGDHAKLDAAAASSQKNAVHDKECSSSNDDDGTASSGSDDDDNEEDEMVSAFFSSMKANLQRVSEPSGLSLQKDEQAKQDALVRLESQFTNCAVKKPCTNGGSTGYGLSWSPEIALSSLKTSKAQLGKPRSVVEARPDTIWGKDRCLQDGLCVPPVHPLKLNKLARKQKNDTAGAKWFNLSAPTITTEIKKELQLVKLRGALDPKRHYKADDSKGLPKYFQVGTVVGGPADFYSGRLTKKEQKSSLASELLSDSSLTAYRKRKYLAIQEQKQAGGKGFWKKKKSKRTPAWANI